MGETVEKKVKRNRGPVGPIVRFVKLSVVDGNGVPVVNPAVTIEEVISDAKEAFKRRNEGFISLEIPRKVVAE